MGFNSGFKGLNKKKLLNTKCVFRISLQILAETFVIPRNERNMILKRCIGLQSCPILMKLEFSGQIFEKKSSNIKFHETPSSDSRVVPCRRTDRH
jgi:hypothetical protein